MRCLVSFFIFTNKNYGNLYLLFSINPIGAYEKTNLHVHATKVSIEKKKAF